MTEGDAHTLSAPSSPREYPEPPARDVLEGVTRRDQASLGTFFDYAYPLVYGLAARLLGNQAEAEDVTQDVFLKVYRAAARLDVARDPRPWLTTITYNACRDHWRRPAVSRTSSLDVEGSVPPLPDGSDTPVEELLRRESEEQVQAAIMKLDVPLREVVILHAYQGCPHDEIATMVGASHAAVRKRYSRALARLGELLRDMDS